MKTPTEILETHKALLNVSGEWVPKHLASKKFDIALNVMAGHQWNLYFVALMQLRWGYDGIRETMDQLDSLVPKFSEAFSAVGTEWAVTKCRLDAHAYLSYLLGRSNIDKPSFEKWVQGSVLKGNWACTHLCNVTLIRALAGEPSPMPCSFTSERKWQLRERTYRNYFALLAAVIDHDGARATAAALDGAALFAKRDKGDSGPSYEGEGYTDYLFDFRLAAILEYAKREHNLEVSVAEPYPTVLANSAAFRVSKAKP